MLFMSLNVALFFLLPLCYCVPVKKYDEYAEYYEGEDVAVGLAEKSLNHGQNANAGKEIRKFSAEKQQHVHRGLFETNNLNLFQNQPTDMALNLLNSVFNVGKKILKPLGIEGEATVFKQQDKSGNEHLESRKEIDFFGLHGKDVDKILMDNGKPTYLSSKKLDFFGTPIGGLDINKGLSINPWQPGYVNCNQYRLLGSVVDDCDKRNFDLSGVPNFFHSALGALNVLGKLQSQSTIG